MFAYLSLIVFLVVWFHVISAILFHFSQNIKIHPYCYRRTNRLTDGRTPGLTNRQTEGPS